MQSILFIYSPWIPNFLWNSAEHWRLCYQSFYVFWLHFQSFPHNVNLRLTNKHVTLSCVNEGSHDFKSSLFKRFTAHPNSFINLRGSGFESHRSSRRGLLYLKRTIWLLECGDPPGGNIGWLEHLSETLDVSREKLPKEEKKHKVKLLFICLTSFVFSHIVG